MNVIAINGSPRKKWNTATLLENALEGASSQGAETEMFHLYDYDFKGCMSCFACKTKDGKSYGQCALKDDLTPVLEKINDADAVILGSPVYFSSVSGEMKSFMERMLFPKIVYADPYQNLFQRKINTGFIYTMNITEDELKSYEILVHNYKYNETMLQFIFGASESLLCHDTFQFKDYSKVVQLRFDPEKKAQRRKDVFPQDCEKAYEMGVRFAKKE